MGYFPKTNVKVSNRGDVFQITVAGESRVDTHDMVRKLLSAVLSNEDLELIDCEIATCQACRSQPTSQ
jgi:hypothetical protein